jgi:ArsR family transcriptional regulator
MTIQHPPIALLTRIADRLRMMGHPSRLMIIGLLKGGERSVGDIAGTLGLSIASASQHLKALESVGLLAGRRAGRQIFYGIQAPMVSQICDALCAQLESELAGAADEYLAFQEMRTWLQQ